MKVWDARMGFHDNPTARPFPDHGATAGNHGPPPTLAGWWILDADSFRLEGTDPYFASDSLPRWYLPADDPNGFVPVAREPVFYLTRVHARRAGRVRLHRDGPIHMRVWVNGQAVADEKEISCDLIAGWNTLATQIIDPVGQSDVIARPNAGFFLRIVDDSKAQR